IDKFKLPSNPHISTRGGSSSSPYAPIPKGRHNTSPCPLIPRQLDLKKKKIDNSSTRKRQTPSNSHNIHEVGEGSLLERAH
ncbi:hypothetical protein PanWU01x14_265610, partial [Parasponia andersonii]